MVLRATYNVASRRIRPAIPMVLVPALALLGSSALAQPNSTAEADDKKAEWVLAPIPINSPAIGTGLEWAVGRVFPLNKRDEFSPPSAVAVGGVFTNNGTRALATGGRLYLKEDKYRVAGGVAGANVNIDLYGVGRLAGERGVFIPLKVNGGGFMGEFLYGVRKGIYIGARGQYRNVTLSLNKDRLNSSDATVQPPEEIADVIGEIQSDLLKQRTASLGPRFTWDTRDNTFYPKRGVLSEVSADFFAKGLGSKWEYQYYKIAFNKYNTLTPHQVLALRAMGCAAAGEHVPVYDLCLFGAMNDLRGYPAGRFQDRRMFAAQAEYRFTVPAKGLLGRFGAVVFAGFGGVDKKFTDIGFSELLPAGGAGVRFRLTKKHPINFRVDYGIGTVGRTLSMGVLEAF